MNEREIHEVFESVYSVTMADDDYVAVSVHDPDEERTDINPGVGVRLTDRESEVWGKWLPCLLVAEDILGNWLVVTTKGRTVQFFGGTEVTHGSPTEIVRACKIPRGVMNHIEDEMEVIERVDVTGVITVGATYVEGPRWALAYLAEGLEKKTEVDVADFVGTNTFNMDLTDEMRAFGIRSALNSYKVAAKRLRNAKCLKRRGKG